MERWAFKHPMPDDFFRTIENVAGEDLNWFWRGWFMNNWQLDQGITKVKYVKNDATQGAIITIVNLEKMPMPVIMDIKTKSGAVTRVKLPVDIWQRNIEWSFKHDSTEELESIIIDPENVFPDINDENNTWTNAKNGVEKTADVSPYLGNFSSKQIPIKIKFTQEDGELIINSEGQPSVPLENKGKDKFTFEQAGLTVQFNENKTGFSLKIGEQSFEFTKDK